jgi:hypothetical protein
MVGYTYIFMNEIVAMEHVQAVPGSIMSLDFDCLARAKPDNVLEPLSFVVVERTVTVGSGQDLEIDKMDVNRMRPTAAAVLKLPYFNRTARHICQHAVGCVGKDDTVDLPLTIGMMELKVMVHTRPRRVRPVNGCQCRRNRAGVCNWGAGYNKSHNLVGVEVVLVVTDVFCVFQRDVLPGKRAEVKNNFIPLAHGNVERGRSCGRCQKPRVRRDYLKGNHGGGTGLSLEIQEECARDRCIQETEPVLARLDIEVRPCLTIDMDNIAKERVVFEGWAEQCAIVVVLLGRQDEGNVKLAVARG